MSVELKSILASPISGKLYNRPVRMAVFGDSTAADYAGVPSFDIEDYPWTSDSTNRAWTWQRLGVLAHIPMQPVAACGIGGQKIGDMIGRSALTATPTRRSMQDVLSKNPDVLIFHGGSINDYSNLTGSETESQILAIAENHCKIADFFIKNGILVVDAGTLGYKEISNVEPHTLFVRSAIVLTNNYIRERFLNESMFKFININGVISINGAFLQGIANDDVHLTSIGGYKLGELEARAIRQVLNPMNTSVSKFESQTTFATTAPTSSPSGYSVNNLSNVTVGAWSTTTFSAKRLFTVTQESGSIRCGATFVPAISAIDAGAESVIGQNFKALIKRIDGVAFIPMISNRLTIRNFDNSITFTNGCTNERMPSNTIQNIDITNVIKLKGEIGSNSSYLLDVAELPAGNYEIEIFPVNVFRF